MKIVIDIPKKVYKAICDKNELGCAIRDIKNIIRNGTPLPKGHGRLIDADRFINDFACHGHIDDMGVGYFRTVTPTIIDADKSEREG